MRKIQVGLIRVLTTKNEEQLQAHARLLKKWFPAYEVISRCIPNNPEGLASREAKAKGIPDIIQLAENWEGIDGLIISCSDDPAIDYLKGKLSIPVIGAGAPAALLASLYFGKIGVLGIEDQVPPNIFNLIDSDRYGGYLKPHGVIDTNSLNSAEQNGSIAQSVRAFKQKGVQIVTSACTGFSLTNLGKIVQDSGLHYVDALFAAGWAMNGLLGLDL